DPVTRENRRVLLSAALGSGDYPSTRAFGSGYGAAAGAGGVYDQLALGGNAVAKAGEVCGADVRPGQIEFILRTIEAAVADQRKCEFVVRFSLAGHLCESLHDAFARRLVATQGVDMNFSARTLQDFVEIGGHGFEPLLVVRLSAEPRDGHKI